MKKIGNNGEIDKLSYKTWPLFIDFRKHPEFPIIFKEVFGEDYSAIELPKSMLEEIESKITALKEEIEHFNLSEDK